MRCVITEVMFRSLDLTKNVNRAVSDDTVMLFSKLDWVFCAQ